MLLPTELQYAIEEELHGVSLRNVSSAARQLRARYRSRAEKPDKNFVQSNDDTLAYTAYRLPATYAAMRFVFTRMQELRPDWRPRTLLDIGAGPGTAFWAAVSVWPDLERAILLESNPQMIDIGRRIGARANPELFHKATFQQQDILRPWQVQPHDLVVAAYLLAELPGQSHGSLFDAAWSSTADSLCVIEPAKSSAGFHTVLSARSHLIEKGARVLAPCPHENQCPMPEGRWCHFATRVERTRFHRLVKEGFRPYEDEKFSYVVACRGKHPGIRGRIVLPPQVTKVGVRLNVCAPLDLEWRFIAKRDKEAFKQAARLRWGDVVPFDNPGEP